MNGEPIRPTNLAAQLHHRAAGNPPSTLPHSAVSNCFPGLEFDFRNIWRRILDGIELHEASGLVVSAPEHDALVAGDWYLLEVAGVKTRMPVTDPAGRQVFEDFIEWSNALAQIVAEHSGETVACTFGQDPNGPLGAQETQIVALPVRPLFASSAATRSSTALIDEALVAPGELTQSLCSPWQNDYRECGCYYWAASRPDYVNVEATGQGTSTGNNWMARDRASEYAPDLPGIGTQHSYEDLFRNWEALLRFIVGGRDAG